MPWCKTCRIEYELGETHCAQCGSNLVLNFTPYADAIRWGKLLSTDTISGHLICETLKSAGIPVYTQLGFDPITALQPMEIYVPENLMTRAVEIINPNNREDYDDGK